MPYNLINVIFTANKKLKICFFKNSNDGF